jgi:hypothetical protein
MPVVTIVKAMNLLAAACGVFGTIILFYLAYAQPEPGGYGDIKKDQ